jgi:hypothetical protein
LEKDEAGLVSTLAPEQNHRSASHFSSLDSLRSGWSISFATQEVTSLSEANPKGKMCPPLTSCRSAKRRSARTYQRLQTISSSIFFGNRLSLVNR